MEETYDALAPSKVGAVNRLEGITCFFIMEETYDALSKVGAVKGRGHHMFLPL